MCAAWVDRLHVAPAERKGDGEILGTLQTLLLEARDLKNCTLRAMKKGQTVNLQEITDDNASGDILIGVKEGVVTLDGWVISLSHKRLAGVLAWWVPGCRDVLDGLEVLPPEQDNDDEVSDALSLVLEMDPMIPHPGADPRPHPTITWSPSKGWSAPKREKTGPNRTPGACSPWDKVINHLAVGR